MAKDCLLTWKSKFQTMCQTLENFFTPTDINLFLHVQKLRKELDELEYVIRNSRSSFGRHLPTVLLESVFSYVQEHEIFELRLVSRSWNSCILRFASFVERKITLKVALNNYFNISLNYFPLKNDYFAELSSSDINLLLSTESGRIIKKPLALISGSELFSEVAKWKSYVRATGTNVLWWISRTCQKFIMIEIDPVRETYQLSDYLTVFMTGTPEVMHSNHWSISSSKRLYTVHHDHLCRIWNLTQGTLETSFTLPCNSLFVQNFLATDEHIFLQSASQTWILNRSGCILTHIPDLQWKLNAFVSPHCSARLMKSYLNTQEGVIITQTVSPRTFFRPIPYYYHRVLFLSWNGSIRQSQWFKSEKLSTFYSTEHFVLMVNDVRLSLYAQ